MRKIPVITIAIFGKTEYRLYPDSLDMEWKIFRTLWQLLKKFHSRIYRMLVYIVFYELLKLIPAAVLALVINAVIGFEASQIPFLIVLLSVLFVGSMIVSWLDIRLAYEASMIDFEAQSSLLKQVAEKLLRLPIGYHEQYNTGRTVHMLHRGVDRFGELLFFTTRELVPTCAQLVLTTAILLWIGIIPGLVFIAFLPLFLYIIHGYGKHVQPLRQEYHEQMNTAAGHIGERIMNIRTVQDYAVEKRELHRYGDILRDFVRLGRRRMDYHRIYFLYRDTVMNIARLAIMGLGVWMVAHGQMTAGVLVFFITLTEKANLSLFRIANIYDRAGDSMEGISAMVRLFEEEGAIVEKSDAVPVTHLNGAVAFRNVSFAYPNGKPVLDNISIDIPPQTMLAVIGRSGAGKSTLVKLLYRHYDVSSGTILVDGKDIRNYKLRQYRRQIALVPQDIEIFNASVRENIAFGSTGLATDKQPGATDDEIIRVSKIAFAHDFIQDFPEGYNTLVGERGVRLSGGQRQRIGIARALLADPAVLVFDEATSSLDTESEQLIQKAMQTIARQYTMIVIAHRLSTIEHADAILVLEDGKIAETGTHEDLIKEGGIYVKMRELQRLGDVRD